MKLLYINLAGLFLFSLIFSEIAAQTVSASQIKKISGFSHPESVVLDESNGILYVSNIGKKEKEDGFISKMGINGDIIKLKWVTGLNDPKGLLFLNNSLWVTDNTDLVLIDVENAIIAERIPVTDASFLNDIAVGKNGIIYISDTGKSSIYRRNVSGEIKELLQTEELEFPNGLLVVGNDIYVAAWGGEGAGNILKMDLDSLSIGKVTSEGLGNLDGIQQKDEDSFYVSDWATGKIYLIDREGAASEIFTTDKSAGDILYIKKTDQIVVPMNIQNEVWWYQLN